MNLHRHCILIIILQFSFLVNYSQETQAKLEKVIPQSPTTSSLAKYGDIPVSYYSGAANISIPLFTIGSGKLHFPISLNYQFSGLKTEEIAGWVGLGWTLQGGGVISRTVRGLPDEIANGYLNPGTMSVDYMINNSTNQIVIDNLKSAGEGNYDTEPDIFYYNIPGYSGKFYYNQSDQKFHTLPIEKLEIYFALETGVFTIFTPDGNKFIFDQKEFTTTTQSCDGNLNGAANMVPTAWYLSAIKNANETEEMSFTYSSGYYTFEGINSENRYFLTSEAGNQDPEGSYPQYNISICSQYSALDVKRLSRITFRGGYLEFTLQGADRCDLPGDRALSKIELYTTTNSLVKGYQFNYGYFGGDINSPCSYPNSNNLRLKLVSLIETPSGGIANINPHVFEYYEDGVFPNRLSYSQDYWGYNNNAASNQSLIPPTIYNYNGTPIFFPGANRTPNFIAARLGGIKKITYPTKGTSDFTYENNEVADPVIEPEAQWIIQSLEGDHVGSQTIYEKTFTVNESPNVFNGGRNGAIITVSVTEPGCDITNGTTCAILSLEGLTPGTTGWGYLTVYNTTGFYLPNGTYKMKAVFNQVPAMFQDFFYSIKWQQPILNASYMVGGVRLKKIINYDGVNHLNDIIKGYSYLSSSTNKSSGKVYGNPYVYTSTFIQEHYWGHENVLDGNCQYGIYIRTFLKRFSHSTFPLIAAGGSNYVGYEEVTETFGENGENGKKVYVYEAYPDLINNMFPYTQTSREWRRGLLKMEKIASATEIKSETSYEYDEFDPYNIQLSRVSNGLKLGFNTSASKGGTCNNSAYFSRFDELRYPIQNEYETLAGKKVISNKLVKQFENGLVNQSTEETVYNNANFIPSEVKSQNSKGEEVRIKYTYPIDYLSTNGTPNWLENLKQKKTIRLPIETYTTVKNSSGQEYVTGGTIITYKTSQPLPDKFYSLEVSSPILLSSFIPSYINNGLFSIDPRYKERIKFNGYDLYYNLLGQSKSGDIVTSYIWGYERRYPVAEIVGMTADAAIATANINLSIINAPTSDYELRNELGKLRQIHGIFVKTYTYKPFVGITSESDINGNTTFYEYDNFNRLQLVRDFQNNILKRICYNFSGQVVDCQNQTVYFNSIQSQTFTRNNCGPCGQGSQVPYTVAANTYNSTISQAAADQLALDDIAANGQNNANAIGTCTSLLPLTYNNQIYGAGGNGFTAVYTERTTGQVYSFTVPGYGSGSLGCIPAGSYNLTISKAGNNTQVLFGSGCFVVSGTSGTFGKVNPANCSQVTLQLDVQ